jgi:hypothetical protein
MGVIRHKEGEPVMATKGDMDYEPGIRRRGIRRFMSRKWWLGLSGVIAALGVLLSLGLWLADRSPTSATGTKHDITAHNGNCIIQGGSDNTCELNPSNAARPSALPSSGSPLTAAVRKNVGPCGHAWIVGKSPSLPKPPPASSDSPGAWVSWAQAARAVDASESSATVTIQARPGKVVYITGIEFKVLQRKAPIQGKIAAPACAGPQLGRYVDVELDRRPPRLIATSSDPTAMVGGTAPGENYAPLKLPYKVTYDDGLVLIIYGQVKKLDCVWSADILWSSGGRNGSFQIDNNGKPFETTPMLISG